jgi:prepilin-type N-terminal cleavage/methylation domain-containing protein
VDKNCVERSYDGRFDGFTLVEILIAMAVASIGLISLAYLQSSAIKANTLSSRFTQATYLAQNILERVKFGHMVQEKTFGYRKVSAAASEMLQDTGEIKGVSQRGDPGGPFNVQWRAATHTEFSRQVAVTVSWRSILGYTRHLRLVSASRGEGI